MVSIERKYSVFLASVDSVTDTQMILRHERQTLHNISLVNIPTFLAFRTPRSGNMLRG